MEAESHRVVFAGGGTGGHLFPALAVADELGRRHPGAEISFVGGRKGIENRLVPAAGYALWTLAISGLKGTGPLARLGGAAAAGWAVVRSLAWMARRRPALVIGVGGYASGPAVLAADLLGLKTMVMEQNHYPGATNRFLAKRADAVCVPSDEAGRRLEAGGVPRSRIVVTGNPVRAEFAGIAEARDEDELSVLIFGGSRGARSINRAVVEALDRLATLGPAPRIVHQTGADDLESVTAAYRSRYPEGRWEVHPFLDDMPARFERAHVVLCRAGATTLAELAAAGRGSILVPYPYAADDHQRLNAETVRDAGGAVVVLDSELDGERIAGLVRELAADRERLRKMGRAARTLSRPDATARIADVADGLLPGASTGGGRVS